MTDSGAPAVTPSAARGRAAIVWLLLLLGAWGCYAARRELIGRFFRDGQPGAPPWPERAARAPGPAAAAVRVVLLDGLSRAHALQLPVLSRACAGGLELAVDVGFPTVSLPVQAVLWGGRTQQQSGLQYRIARLDPPPPDMLPARVAGSVAVAESHRDIVHSFGFAQVQPPLARDDIEAAGSSWRTHEFAAAAREAIASAAPLVFVHVLRIDEAGHAHGGDSPQYAAAAADADAWLQQWLDAGPPGARWWVLADHGHRPRGGHGDAEPEIRIVRACVLGGTATGDRSATPIHLVDVHRELADALGLAPVDDAPGRPLAQALADPRPEQTLPRPGGGAWALAACLLAAAAWVTLASAAARRLAPWSVLSLGSVLAVHGAITLSNPAVYPPLGAGVLLAASPGFVYLSIAFARRPSARAVVLALALPLGATAATAILAGVPASLWRPAPPLVPRASAWCSVCFTVTGGALATVALAWAVVAAWRGLQAARRARG